MSVVLCLIKLNRISYYEFIEATIRLSLNLFYLRIATDTWKNDKNKTGTERDREKDGAIIVVIFIVIETVFVIGSNNIVKTYLAVILHTS